MAKISPKRKASSGERLRASPNFALAFSMDGRPYVAKEVEPYIQYWLNERYRVLLALFSGRSGATPADAVKAYFRFTKARDTKPERARLLKAIEDMRSAGVLAGVRDDTSRYSARMAQDYLTHRPFPQEIADVVIQTAPVTEETRVLDLAGGPGSLALALARVSQNVSLMELSRGFVAAAKREAKRAGLRLNAIHESCNRLVYQDGEYDVITVSQALHWLDDVMVCRGVTRSLTKTGSFFVVQAAINIDDDHPLSFVLGDRSVLGHKAKQSFAAQVQALHRRLALLFEALDAPDVQRIDPSQGWGEEKSRIASAGITHFHQTRPFGMGFARAFLSSAHIVQTGQTPPQFWIDLAARCAAAEPARMLGSMDWAVLHFRRGGAGDAQEMPEKAPFEIGYHGSPEG